MSEKRIKETTLDKSKQYKKGGYLQDIDKFDYKFFDISYAEAIYMSPMQRASLEVAYNLFENAGYNPAEFNGSDVSVFISGPWFPDYAKHADEINTLLDTGNSPEFMGAKVSRELNLLGNCVLVNTACSASIAALQMGANELILGDCEMAMILSGNLDLFPLAGSESETVSKTGASTAFSDDVDGMVYGESIAGILLKPLKKAIADNDVIHAVVSGWANNNNGNRSSSILATDSKQQCEVYLKAWNRAGITPEQLGFIEAHGSATQLGDCLEIEGLDEAFRKFTPEKNLVPVSSIKSNIGHTLAAAGMAGIIKTVLSLKHKVLFANINKGRLNSNIDFTQSSVYVIREFKEWKTKDGESRIAGVSGFGRGGTNGHVVLREYTASEKTVEDNIQKSYLFTISSKTRDGLRRNIANILKKLPQYRESQLKDLSYTLIRGRQHMEYRLAIVCGSLQELQERLTDAMDREVTETESVEDCFFVFSDQKITMDYFKY
ncbi:MAG: beta-ketoacyl synthase N-terminal-like domain-containing protein, partial [Bacteroidota bacterium]